MTLTLTIGVLALQGGFYEHLNLLKRASHHLHTSPATQALPNFTFLEVRNPSELSTCDALVIPGGESTTMALVAAQSGLLEPLRNFVKVHKKPVWGTCAGLIFLSSSAHDAKAGGQELVGGLSVRVHRNHFGRQVESFVAPLELPFLKTSESRGAGGNGVGDGDGGAFEGVFIRAPIVEEILTSSSSTEAEGEGGDGEGGDGVVVRGKKGPVEVMGVLPGRRGKAGLTPVTPASGVGNGAPDVVNGEGGEKKDVGDVIAVRQDNVFGTSFHPELTNDTRIHMWWLGEVVRAVGAVRN